MEDGGDVMEARPPDKGKRKKNSSPNPGGVKSKIARNIKC